MKGKLRVFISILLFLGFLASSYFAAESFATYKIKTKIDKRLSKLPYEISYRDLKYKLLQNDLVIRDFSLKGEIFWFSSGKISVDLPWNFREKAFPPQLFFSILNNSLHVDFPLLSGIYPKNLEFNVAGGYEFSKNQLSVTLISSVKEIGNFALNLELSNLSYRTLERLFERRKTPRSVINNGQLKYISLKFENRGIFEKFLTYAASQEGVSVEKVKEELLNTIENSLKNKLIYEKVGKPLEEFIRKPNCIEVTVKPREPVKLKSLKKILVRTPNVEKLLQDFGVELKACS